jgi:hypothetical protein
MSKLHVVHRLKSSTYMEMGFAWLPESFHIRILATEICKYHIPNIGSLLNIQKNCTLFFHSYKIYDIIVVLVTIIYWYNKLNKCFFPLIRIW